MYGQTVSVTLVKLSHVQMYTPELWLRYVTYQTGSDEWIGYHMGYHTNVSLHHDFISGNLQS